ncbi:MAG: EAL domain-containing protein [Hyphomicrobium sp.]|nr:EAL domain-containing protein [Hyphomicrobium sp.]
MIDHGSPLPPAPPAFDLLVAGEQPLHRLARLAILLEAEGFRLQVVRCLDGKAAGAALRERCFDAALLDATLADGTLLTSLRKADLPGRGTPLFFLAEGESYPDARKLSEIGAHTYLAGGARLEEQLALDMLAPVRKADPGRALNPPSAGVGQPILPRDGLVEAMERLMVDARTRRQSIGYLCLDIQDFRGINRLFGHRTADTVIQAVGRRLRDSIRAVDIVGHLGGDRFGVVLTQKTTLEAARTVARKLLDLFTEPVVASGETFRLNVVVGVTAAPDHGSSVDELLVAADIATEAAKASPTSIASFTGAAAGDPATLHALSGDLHLAAERDEYLLFYQPKIDLASGGLCGAEALIRWQHPTRGRLSPDAFIPIAERNGSIEDLTRWAMRRALRDRAALASRGCVMPISVNLSAASLRSWRIVSCIEDTLREENAPAGALSFEITESVLIRDIDRARAVLTAVRNLGASISIDDFGAGYSSIGYLRTLPIDEIKIDRSLISTMLNSPRDRAIVRSIIDLGRALGFNVVAEGVEDQRTMLALTELGCAAAQGYHISAPVQIDAFEQWRLNWQRPQRLVGAG